MFTYLKPTLRRREAWCDALVLGGTLMQLLLSDDETILLRDLLADYLPALKREVARTEQHDLRHLMVQRQDLVERLVEQLGERTA